MTAKDTTTREREKRLAEALKANLRRRKAGHRQAPASAEAAVDPQSEAQND